MHNFDIELSKRLFVKMFPNLRVKEEPTIEEANFIIAMWNKMHGEKPEKQQPIEKHEWSANFGATSFTYPVPAGYRAELTSNLKLPAQFLKDVSITKPNLRNLTFDLQKDPNVI